MSKNSPTALSPESKATSSAAEENVTPPKTSDKGLASLTTLPLTEVGKTVKVIQKAQVSSLPKSDTEKEPKEKSQSLRTPPSPAAQSHRYALEIWIRVKVNLGEYASTEEDTYSAEFLMDTLKLAYPGCTRVYLDEAAHLIAFYRKKGAAKAGLSVEQGMEACQILADSHVDG